MVAGWLTGLLVVFFVARFEGRVAHAFQSVGLGAQLAIAMIATLTLLGAQHFVFSQWGEDFQTPQSWEQQYRDAVIYEELIDGDIQAATDFHETTRLDLYEAFSGSQIGVFLGVWVLAIAVARWGGYMPASRKESWITTLIGLPLILMLLPLFALVQGTGIVEILTWACLPIVLGMGLTRFVDKRMSSPNGGPP